jgi:hypothetical protein
MPFFYRPTITPDVDVVFLPHKVDTKWLNEYLHANPPSYSYHVVDLAVDHTGIERVIDELHRGRVVVASSLHGIIVGHAYEKPTIWLKTHHALHGDGIKFLDHFATMGIDKPRPQRIETLTLEYPQPNLEHLHTIQAQVLKDIEKVFAEEQ